MAEKFNIRPVYVDFLNTLNEKLSSSDVGSEIHVSRKESCDGPISEVNISGLGGNNLVYLGMVHVVYLT